MNTLSIDESYKILNVAPDASDEEIARAFKTLAMRYHPDRNSDRVEWATKIMSRINEAYSTVSSARFRSEAPAEQPRQEEDRSGEERAYEEALRRRKEFERQRVDSVLREASINSFVRIRENAKEALYQFFQYGLFNIAQRENIQNMRTYNAVVLSLRRSYHAIMELLKATKDPEVTEHLTVFSGMIFNFFRAAECLNIPDSYENAADAEAFRLYRRGEDVLHLSHREVFYERHNRGSFEMASAVHNASEARRLFAATILKYPDSSWTVEAKIKLEYTESLLGYIELFFSEE